MNMSTPFLYASLAYKDYGIRVIIPYKRLPFFRILLSAFHLPPRKPHPYHRS
jgi:hypothetical protein